MAAHMAPRITSHAFLKTMTRWDKMKSTNSVQHPIGLSRNVWIHFVLELVFWNNLSRNLCAEISLGAIFETGWKAQVRQFWFKRWGISQNLNSNSNFKRWGIRQTFSPFFESHKFLFSHFHLQVKNLNLNFGASVKITLPSLVLKSKSKKGQNVQECHQQYQ